MLSKKMIWRAACLAALIFLPACGAGDDDGRRLGDIIVGTWQRGWGEGDVVIEGTTELNPEDFSYDKFVFRDDGSYNGMVRKGSFSAWSFSGSLICARLADTDTQRAAEDALPRHRRHVRQAKPRVALEQKPLPNLLRKSPHPQRPNPRHLLRHEEQRLVAWHLLRRRKLRPAD